MIPSISRLILLGAAWSLPAGGNPLVQGAEAVPPPAIQALTNESLHSMPANIDPGSLDLVWIPPGTFIMGSPASEPDRAADEGPQTQVDLSPGFFMGKYEVTQREYQI